MDLSMSMTAALLAVYLLVPTGILSIAEYFLARLESPWPGRVLPILSAACSLCVSAVILFNTAAGAPFPALLVPALALVLLNLPTALFLIVYRNTRLRYAERRNMDRVDIQEL